MFIPPVRRTGGGNGSRKGRKKENMLRAMDSAVAGLRAHQNKMDVVGHNIANVNTFGFKAQTYTFKEAMYQTSTSSTGGTATAAGTNAAQYGYGALMGTIGVDMTASTPTYVGGFNASISGDGFFITKKTKSSTTIATDAATTSENVKGGDFLYTRVGQFTLDSNGYVVDGDKNFVYGFMPTSTDNNVVDTTKLVPLRMPVEFTKATTAAGKDTVTFDGDNTTITKDALLSKGVEINSAGEITVKLQYTNATTKETDSATVSLGKLAIATFQNPNGLNKAGGNYYTTTKGDNSGVVSATIPGGGTPDLMTGYVEASNVDLAKEFADMITTHRGFQSNTKMITVSDEMLSDLVAMKR